MALYGDVDAITAVKGSRRACDLRLSMGYHVVLDFVETTKVIPNSLFDGDMSRSTYTKHIPGIGHAAKDEMKEKKTTQ